MLKKHTQSSALISNLENSYHVRHLTKFKKYVSILLCFVSVAKIYATGFENGRITGSLMDEQTEPVPFANVVLKNRNDSSLYKAELSNDKGEFFFDKIKYGSYFIQITMVGFEMFVKSDIEINEKDSIINLGVLKLLPSTTSLKTVSVVSEKPFIERVQGKTVVNIENSSVSKGSTALEVMEKLPGVQVSNDGAISLKGRSNVNVIIDGKQTMLSSDNLATLLRGMSSSSIQKVEIITNPSAKYDAAGTAGIINIVTKKNKREGLNGTFSIGYGQGRYEKANVGLDLSKKNKFSNIFLNYSFSHRKEFSDFRLIRDFPINSNPNSVIESNSYVINPNDNHLPKLGADFYLSKRTTLSVMGTGLFYSSKANNTSNSTILNANKEKIMSYDFRNDLKGSWKSYIANARLTHQLDTNGRDLSIDLDYANYFNNVDQTNSIILKDQNGNFVNDIFFVGNQDWKLNIYSAKVDYTHPLTKTLVIETGLKSSYIYSNSDNAFLNQTVNELSYDSARSNHFVYSENINAAYLIVRKEYKKFTYQPGLRVEQTIVKGEQLLTKQKIQRDYTKLFPSLSIDYIPNDRHSWSLTLAKRIDRPAYQLLDPFRLLTDVGTYSQGNPKLNPSITYMSEVGYSWKNTFFATLGYSLNKDGVTSILIHDANNEITLRTPANMDYLHSYNAGFMYSKKITSWWSSNTSFTPFYLIYTGNISGYELYQSSAFSFSCNTSNSFYLMDGLSMECSFFYNHTNLTGISLIKPFYSLNAGLKKMLLNKRATLTININDLLYTNNIRGTAHFGTKEMELISNFRGRRDSRVLNVTFSSQFGKGAVGRMRRSSGGEEEKNRVGVRY